MKTRKSSEAVSMAKKDMRDGKQKMCSAVQQALSSQFYMTSYSTRLPTILKTKPECVFQLRYQDFHKVKF